MDLRSFPHHLATNDAGLPHVRLSHASLQLSPAAASPLAHTHARVPTGTAMSRPAHHPAARALPASWSPVPAPLGGEWLLAEPDDSCEAARAVIAPGVSAVAGEPLGQRLTWRLATWHDDVCDGPPDRLDVLSLDEAVELLGAAHRDRVRAICVAVLRHLESYAHDFDGRPDEERARLAAAHTAGLRAEARSAFPDDEWGGTPAPDLPEMPETPRELLRRVDGRDVARADELWEQLTVLYRRAVGDYRAAVRIARRVRKRAQKSARFVHRLRV